MDGWIDSIGCLFDWLIDSLDVWLIGWLIDWLVGLLFGVGWLVAFLTDGWLDLMCDWWLLV